MPGFLDGLWVLVFGHLKAFESLDSMLDFVIDYVDHFTVVFEECFSFLELLNVLSSLIDLVLQLILHELDVSVVQDHFQV